MGIWVIERKRYRTWVVRVRNERHWNGGKPWEKGYGRDKMQAEKVAAEIRALIQTKEMGYGDTILVRDALPRWLHDYRHSLAPAWRETAEATIALKRAQVEATRAQIREIEEDRNRAKEDLADCKLLAPFSGRITKLHVVQGAVVAAGTPVVMLTLMDPMKVSVVVSADEDRKIRYGDHAELYPRDPVHPDQQPTVLSALVYEKAEVHLNSIRIEGLDALLSRVGMEELTKEERIVDRRQSAVSREGHPAS